MEISGHNIISEDNKDKLSKGRHCPNVHCALKNSSTEYVDSTTYDRWYEDITHGNEDMNIKGRNRDFTLFELTSSASSLSSSVAHIDFTLSPLFNSSNSKMHLQQSPSYLPSQEPRSLSLRRHHIFVNDDPQSLSELQQTRQPRCQEDIVMPSSSTISTPISPDSNANTTTTMEATSREQQHRGEIHHDTLQHRCLHSLTLQQGDHHNSLLRRSSASLSSSSLHHSASGRSSIINVIINSLYDSVRIKNYSDANDIEESEPYENSNNTSKPCRNYYNNNVLPERPSTSLFRWKDVGMWLRLVVTFFLIVSSLHPVQARPTSDADRMYKKLQMDTVKYLAQFGYLNGPNREAQSLLHMKEREKAIKKLQKAGGIPQTGVPDSRTAELILRPRCGNTDEFIDESSIGKYNYADSSRSISGGSGANGYRFRRSDDDNSYRPPSSDGIESRHRRSSDPDGGSFVPSHADGHASDIDSGTSNTLSRKKRYTIATSKWPNTNLTFRFINYTPDLPQSKTRQIISDALQVWSDATPLSFTEVRDSQADIMVQFASNYHSDGYPFDGKGMVLAHAFFPGYGKGGDTHFDDDENWASASDGVDLFLVAAHEFGHALGLAHSGDPEALMYPWYMGFEGKFKLPQDDYLGITNLYGSKEKTRVIPKYPSKDKGVVLIPKGGKPTRDRNYDVTTPKIKTKGSGPIDPCRSPVDAITVFRTELFIFIGKWFWRLDSRKIIGDPVEIHSFWYGLPKDLKKIDAAFERHDSKLIFFSGDRYWLFNANHRKSGFPTKGRPITEFNIPADVKKIDAAFVWGYNKRTYLVSGDMYWKLNEDNTFVEYDYPRDIGTWRGVPVPLDAAYRDWDGKTYFFKGLDFYQFYDMKMQVRRGYPKEFSRHMLSCPKPDVKGQEYKIDDQQKNPASHVGAGSNSIISHDNDSKNDSKNEDKTNKKENNGSILISQPIAFVLTVVCVIVNTFF